MKTLFNIVFYFVFAAAFISLGMWLYENYPVIGLVGIIAMAVVANFLPDRWGKLFNKKDNQLSG